MSIEHWEPLHELAALRNSVNRLFDETFRRPGSEGGGGGRELPAMDVYETADAVVVEAHLPGIKRDDLEITVSETSLSLKGERKARADVKEAHYLCHEVYYGAFLRRIALPTGCAFDRAEATFANGVLTITIPRRPVAQPVRLTLEPEEQPA